MAIEDAIYARTAAYAAVTAITTRIHRGIAAQTAALPFVVINRISTVRYPSMTGYTGALATVRFQLDCYAALPTTADALAEALRNCWAGLGGAGPVTQSGETLYAVFLEADRAAPLIPEFSQDESVHRRIVELEVWYGEAVPTL